MLEEITGDRRMGVNLDGLACTQTSLRRGESVRVPFVKSSGSASNPTLGFDAAWLADRALRLPPGRWRVIAQFHPLSTSACDTVFHDVDASMEILVER